MRQTTKFLRRLIVWITPNEPMIRLLHLLSLLVCWKKLSFNFFLDENKLKWLTNPFWQQSIEIKTISSYYIVERASNAFLIISMWYYVHIKQAFLFRLSVSFQKFVDHALVNTILFKWILKPTRYQLITLTTTPQISSLGTLKPWIFQCIGFWV
jgi:hypothetical protein